MEKHPAICNNGGEVCVVTKSVPETREGFLKTLVVVATAILILILSYVAYLYLTSSPPTSPPEETQIFLWEEGVPRTLNDGEDNLYNTLLQIMHRINSEETCGPEEDLSKEQIDSVKSTNKVLELVLEQAEEVGINQWIELDKRGEITTDEYGYRLLRGTKEALFMLETTEESALEWEARIVIGLERETGISYTCWSVRDNGTGNFNKDWIGEINKILFQESMEPPPTPDKLIVTKVIDGDTIVLEDGEKVRYIGIDAPEKDECYGKKATVRNESLVLGREVQLYKDVSGRDRFGRLLRYVWVEETFINDLLVREGYATASPQSPDIRYEDQLQEAQEEAKENYRGLWDTCPPIPLTSLTKTTGTVIVNPECSQLNAPGDDNLNKNQEYVCFTNRDTFSISMGGWAVEDGWYGWVYIFPTFTLKRGKSVRLHTGCGENSGTDLYWCKLGYEIWRNEGGTIFLRDSSKTVIDTYHYKTQKEPR